jgi:hypothetical protein
MYKLNLVIICAYGKNTGSLELTTDHGFRQICWNRSPVDKRIVLVHLIFFLPNVAQVVVTSGLQHLRTMRQYSTTCLARPKY